jgi:hypothetical protein
MYRSEAHFEADEDYDAMGTYDAGKEDIDNTIDTIKSKHPTFKADRDSVYYLTYQSQPSNKFHCFLLLQDKSGSWYAMNGAARIGYGPQVHRIAGPTSQEQARGALVKKMRTKERKGYSIMFSPTTTTRWYKSAETQYMELPVIPDSYGTDSATEMGGRGVPVWYGSAEGMEMTPDIMDYPGLPVIPDSYGTNSALESGQGVPVWYGSAETDMVEVPIKVVAVKDGDWNEYEGKMSIRDDGSLDEYELEEQIRSSIEEGDYEILDVGDEDWDELDVTWVGHPVWESLKHSYEAEGANPSGGSTGNQVVSWESGGLSSPSGPPSDIYWAEDDDGKFLCDSCGKLADFNFQDIDVRWDIDGGEFTGNYELRQHLGDYNDFYCMACAEKQGFAAEWSETDAAHVLLRRKAKKQRTIDRKRSRRQKYGAETFESMVTNTNSNIIAIENRAGRKLSPAEVKKIKENSAKIDAAIAAGDYDKVQKLLNKFDAEGERIRNAGELVEYIDGVWKGQVSTGGPFTLPPYLDDLLAQDLQETMRSDDELDLLFRDGSMASCIYDARNDTLNTFVVAYDGDSSFNSETLDSYAWDKTEYEKKDLEIVKPFGTAMKATMGVAAGTAAILGIMVALTKIGGKQ